MPESSERRHINNERYSMMNINNKNTDKLLEYFDNHDSISENEIDSLLNTEDGLAAWQEIGDLDEAANRSMGKLPDIDREWEAFSERVTQKKLFPVWKAALAAAAVILVAFLISYPDWHTREVREEVAMLEDIIEKAETADATDDAARKTTERQQRIVTVDVPAGEMKTVTLPDGTEVCLNAKSTLVYPAAFGKSVRRVALTGEAYFKVKSDKRHPFIIHTQNISTRVLGTEFNVRSYDANDTHVTLVNGSVEVSSHNEKVRIEPNQDARLEDGQLVIADVNPKDFTSWREGVMYFDDASLRTILQQLSAWYDISVVCGNASLLDKHFHFMYYKDDSLDTVLRLLNESSELNVKVADNAIHVE